MVATCLLFSFTILSCQKGLEENDLDPPHTDSIILTRVEIVDSTATAPSNKSIYTIDYDNQGRMIANKYHFYNPFTAAIDSNYLINVTYTGNDTLPRTLNEFDKSSSPNPLDVSTWTDTRWYLYDAQGRVSRDSLYMIYRASNTDYHSSYVYEYTYFADGFNEKITFVDITQGGGYETERRYFVQKDSRGNTLSQQYSDINSNVKVVEEFSYDDHPNPLYKTYLPHYPNVSMVMTAPLYLGNLQPQVNNFLTYRLTVYDLATNAVTHSSSQQYSYVYKPNGYPLTGRVVNTPAQPLYDDETFNYFYR